MRRKKKPRHRISINSKKEPRRREIPESTETEKVAWRIGIIDRYGHDGEWGWNDIKNEVLRTQIIEKMKHLETMTWAEVKKRKTTDFVPFSELCPNARRYLEDLGMDDIDGLLHLGLSGKERMWGNRERGVFELLWYDPEHTVCPSFKKHT